MSYEKRSRVMVASPISKAPISELLSPACPVKVRSLRPSGLSVCPPVRPPALSVCPVQVPVSPSARPSGPSACLARPRLYRTVRLSRPGPPLYCPDPPGPVLPRQGPESTRAVSLTYLTRVPCYRALGPRAPWYTEPTVHYGPRGLGYPRDTW